MRTKPTARKSTGGIAPRINLGAADTKPAASNNPSTVFNDEEKKVVVAPSSYWVSRGIRLLTRRVDSDDDDDEPQPSVSLASAVASKRKAADDGDDEKEDANAKQAKESVHLDDDVIDHVNKTLAGIAFDVDVNIPARSTIAGEEIRGTTPAAVVTVFHRGIQVCLSKSTAKMNVSIVLEGEFETDTGLLDARSAMVFAVCPQIKNFDTAPFNVMWGVSRNVSVGYPRRVKYTLNCSGHTIELVLPRLVADIIQYKLTNDPVLAVTYSPTSDVDEEEEEQD